MATMIQCAVCGKMISSDEYELLDNASPACPECVAKEQSREEAKE